MELLQQYGLPVWVMEPLRGGKLATLSNARTAKLNALRPREGVPAWAFHFLQSLPMVAVTLSGMSSLAQVQENIRTYEEALPLNAQEFAALLGIADEMVQSTALPCTGCRYCLNHCPQELAIPDLLNLYNEHTVTGGGFIAPMVLRAVPQNKRPDACIGCRSCAAVCPQQIKISKAMASFVKNCAVDGIKHIF